MQSIQAIRSRLENAARKVKARMPDVARGVLHRLETAYRATRGVRPDASVETRNAAGAGAQPAAQPAAQVDAQRSEPSMQAASVPKQVNWELRSQAELVDHIEQHFHAGLRRDLPLLIERARRVEREHAGHASVPRGLADLLESFASNLESHMMKEERMLFPTLRTGSRGGPVDMPIRMMEREHDDHTDELEQIRQLANDLVAPADAPTDWKELYAGLARLELDLRQHIYLENNVLFARAIGGEY